MDPKKIVLYLFYVAVGLMLIFLPFSNYMMSVSQFGLVGVFILHGIKRQEVADFFENHSGASRVLLFIPAGFIWIFRALGRNFREFFKADNAPAWVFASIYLFHVAGLIFTTDFDYAWRDLRIKLPILLMPLLLSTTCVMDRKGFRFMMYLFTAAVFTGTLVSTYHYLTGNFTDSREISRFISHIRFSLLIDMAIFILAYMVLKKSDIPKWPKIVMAAIALWMVAFLVLAAFMTGLVILLVTAAILVFYLVLVKQRLALRLVTIAGVVAMFIIAFFYLRSIERAVNHINAVDVNTLEKTTKLGNPYWHDLSNPQTENGFYVWHYVATDELRKAWNLRSNFGYDGKDKAGQEIRYTIIRFLTSKGLRKDADGVSKLTDKEVAQIEGGVASTVYLERSNLYVRVYKIFWEYRRYQETQNPSGHSVMQRIEFWKTARAIIKSNWLTGVGTGDLDDAFQEEYAKSGSLLEKEFRWHSHNQFLSILATFGFLGLAWFLFALIFPAVWLVKFPDYYFLSFFIIIMLSMLTEDTLETQAGVTVFAFFYSFFLFPKKFIDIV